MSHFQKKKKKRRNYANVWTTIEPIKITTWFSGRDATAWH